MNQNLLYKWLFIAGVVVACILGVTGFPKNLKELRDNAGERIHLGLDLRGGTHLILEVQVDDAVNAETEQAADRLRELLKKANINYDAVSRADLGQILVKGISADKSRDFDDLLNNRFESVWQRGRAPQDPNAPPGSKIGRAHV